MDNTNNTTDTTDASAHAATATLTERIVRRLGEKEMQILLLEERLDNTANGGVGG